MPDETTEQPEEKGEMQTYDEKRLAKLSVTGKKWNNISLLFFGIAIVWLLLLKYADMEIIIGPVDSLLLLISTMTLAVISLILSAYFTWRARTLRKEIEYYSTDQEPTEENQNADL